MNLGVTTIRGHLWLAHNLKEKFLTRRQLSLETCLFGSRWWKRRMKAQGWAALKLSANDAHCWFQPTPRHTYSEACETEPSWDTQIRGGRCDEEPGACYIWELGSMLALFPSPLPPRPSLCVHGCDTTWYTKSTVLFCVFLCTIISSLLALSLICWGLSRLMCVALVCSFHSHESSMTSGHTHICQLMDPDFWFAENANGPRIKSHVHSSKISQGCLPRMEISGFWNIQGAIWPYFQITLIYSPISKNPHFPTSSLTFGTIGCQMLHLWGVRRDLFACLLFSFPVISEAEDMLMFPSLYSLSFLMLTFLLGVCLWYYWAEYLYVIWRVTCVVGFFL